MSLAPAVSKDGFAYAGDLFAEASGHNRHRRATVAELKDHFKSGSEKDHPAHWFEAQLIHYGLQPSKTKAVARMRLFDAVNGGKLSVPVHIKKLESELKKDWTKNERDAKKALKDTKSPTVKSAKRKAESENVDLTVNVGGINITVSASNSAKKTKTTSKPATPSKAAKKTPQPKPPTKIPPKTTATPKTAPSSVTKPKPKPKPKTASEPRIKAEAPAVTTPTRPIQTARRGGSWARRGRTTGPARSSHSRLGDSESPPPYYKAEDSDSNDFGSGYGNDDDDGAELKPLGLLNGRYEVTSDDVEGQWGFEDLSLVFTLSGSELWGRFDLGVVDGVLRFATRPYQSSPARVGFKWRGRERDGPMMYGDRNDGWIRFLGDGRLDGYLDFMDLRFEARRLPGQGTRSEVEARDMLAEWNGYNADEYERENRARWH
ncbi:hypothetical protein F4818DRAFT_23206 [Hypoxylon cercidicola]|nr:hypothetical protein F4818DRAFT_23206 [Hypoxylon cercidicola]